MSSRVGLSLCPSWHLVPYLLSTPTLLFLRRDTVTRGEGDVCCADPQLQSGVVNLEFCSLCLKSILAVFCQYHEDLVLLVSSLRNYSQ